MRPVIASLLIAALLAMLGAGAVIYAGVYDIGATAPHWRITSWLLETARTRSIKAQAAGIAVPPGLDDPAKLIIGVLQTIVLAGERLRVFLVSYAMCISGGRYQTGR